MHTYHQAKSVAFTRYVHAFECSANGDSVLCMPSLHAGHMQSLFAERYGIHFRRAAEAVRPVFSTALKGTAGFVVESGHGVGADSRRAK